MHSTAAEILILIIQNIIAFVVKHCGGMILTHKNKILSGEVMNELLPNSTEAALEKHKPDINDPVDVISKVGGLDIAAMCGFDCIWVDMEHIPNDYAFIENSVRAAKNFDVDVLCRVAKGGYNDLIRPLEADSTGIMVPHLMSLEEAKKIAKKYTLGTFVEREVKPKNFRRLSAGAAKSVIIQAIREAERKIAQDAYEAKREEIITATVSKIDDETGDVIIFTGTGNARLRQTEQIPGEEFFIGQKIKIYICEVNREARGPLVTISRAHPGLVRRMFELEVPEIQEGIVSIKGIAREAGSRTKIAVFSEDESVDPVGSCVGAKGMRINTILGELDGEKVDIVKYSEDPAEYIAAALAPATVESVTMLGEKTAHVVVRADQLSLAIGREGQNARLAARLTGCKIDIKPE